MIADAAQRASRAISELLSNERVFGYVQRGLSFSLDARRLFVRNADRVLAAINVPSQLDVERLAEKVEALDHDLERLTERIDQLIARRRNPV